MPAHPVHDVDRLRRTKQPNRFQTRGADGTAADEPAHTSVTGSPHITPTSSNGKLGAMGGGGMVR